MVDLSQTVSHIKELSPGAVDRKFGLYFGGFGPQDGSQRRENGWGIPGACPGVDSQDLATILDPFRAILMIWGRTDL